MRKVWWVDDRRGPKKRRAWRPKTSFCAAAMGVDQGARSWGTGLPGALRGMPVTPALAVDLPKVDVDISTHDGGGDWYKNPVVIGGGAALLFLLVVLAAMAHSKLAIYGGIGANAAIAVTKLTTARIGGVPDSWVSIALCVPAYGRRYSTMRMMEP